MFDRLSARLEEVFKRLRSRGILSEADVETALKDVRLALLEADVHFKVVKTFLEGIRKKAIGLEVREALTPGQEVVKIVWEGLRQLMGEEYSSSGGWQQVAAWLQQQGALAGGGPGGGKASGCAP